MDKETTCLLLETIYIDMMKKQYPEYSDNMYFPSPVDWNLSNNYDKKIHLLVEAINEKRKVYDLEERNEFVETRIEEVHIDL